MPTCAATRAVPTMGAFNIGSRRRAIRRGSFALIPVSAFRSPTPTPRLPKPGPTQEQDAPLLDTRQQDKSKPALRVWRILVRPASGKTPSVANDAVAGRTECA